MSGGQDAAFATGCSSRYLSTISSHPVSGGVRCCRRVMLAAKLQPRMAVPGREANGSFPCVASGSDRSEFGAADSIVMERIRQEGRNYSCLVAKGRGTGDRSPLRRYSGVIASALRFRPYNQATFGPDTRHPPRRPRHHQGRGRHWRNCYLNQRKTSRSESLAAVCLYATRMIQQRQAPPVDLSDVANQ